MPQPFSTVDQLKTVSSAYQLMHGIITTALRFHHRLFVEMFVTTTYMYLFSLLVNYITGGSNENSEYLHRYLHVTKASEYKGFTTAEIFAINKIK